MNLETLASLARPAGPQDAGLPVVRVEHADEVAGLVAWFGADPARAAATLVIRGDHAGVIERTALYGLVSGRTLGWGDSIGATLPGAPRWEPYELVCPIPDCPASPVWVLSYDAAAPPGCTAHPGAGLRPRS